MFELFPRRRSILDAGLLKDAVDNHSHILYGLDDGVKTQEDSLAILRWLEEQGVSEVWCTPHVMEDVPNTTEAIRTRFGEMQAVYDGGLKLHLAAETMPRGSESSGNTQRNTALTVDGYTLSLAPEGRLRTARGPIHM